MIGVCVVVMFAGAICALRDQHARDSGWTHSLGVTLVGLGIVGCMVIGSWNLVVSASAYIRHQQDLAIIIPPPAER